MLRLFAALDSLLMLRLLAALDSLLMLRLLAALEKSIRQTNCRLGLDYFRIRLS
jgi:hypothetical protein